MKKSIILLIMIFVFCLFRKCTYVIQKVVSKTNNH